MSSDISRNTFDPKAGYSLVRMQQGRLFSDADWNEQGDILRQSDRLTAGDVIGPSGFPRGHDGFALRVDQQSGMIVIGEGVGHVAGVRHQATYGARIRVLKNDASSANPYWQIEGPGAVSVNDLLVLGYGDAASFHVVSQSNVNSVGQHQFRMVPNPDPDTADVRIGLAVQSQPFVTPDLAALGDGEYVAFLVSMDVPETSLDAPGLREIAFDGPDTATRDRLIWHVGIIAYKTLQENGWGDINCTTLTRDFDPMRFGKEPAKLSARAEVTSLSDGPCTLPPASGYRSLENLLYRVEIHNPGSVQQATLKWSRENAIYRTRHTDITAGQLVVESVGRDDKTALKPGDWVEVRDDAARFSHAPGFFVLLGEIVGQQIAILEVLDPLTLGPLSSGGQPDWEKLPASGFVTRWEGGRPQPVADFTTDWADLENGIQIQFGLGRLLAGDFWTIPARAVSGGVDWPRAPGTDAPASLPPQGPRRDFAALATLKKDSGDWSIQDDCRRIYTPLSDALEVTVAGGDGQEVLGDHLSPDSWVILPSKLRVAVTRGGLPVEGERVRFSVIEGDGRFETGTGPREFVTNVNGIAKTTFAIRNRSANIRNHRVVATRINAAGQATHPQLVFSATLSRATDVSFDPRGVPQLSGTRTVQEAIEALAARGAAHCSTYIIRTQQEWEQVLRDLKPKEDASICIGPGDFTGTKTVNMTDLGHIRIHGAGAGITRILVDRAESALAFVACEDITISDITITAPAMNRGLMQGDQLNMNGALDFSHCVRVSVRNCELRCGGGAAPWRTCLTVRGWSGELKTPQPTQSVTVNDNHFVVGNMQEAMLITDAENVSVTGNSITVQPGGRASTGFGKALYDRKWRAQMRGQLVNRVEGRYVDSKRNEKAIQFKDKKVAFESPVAQEDWDEMVRRKPPTSNMLKNDAAFQRYAEKIVESVLENQKVAPSFVRHIAHLSKAMDRPESEFSSVEVQRELLVTSRMRVVSAPPSLTRSSNRIVLEVNGVGITFYSPVSQQDWDTAIGTTDLNTQVSTRPTLARLARKLAGKMLTDEGFRKNMPSVHRMIGVVQTESPRTINQGIVCGGRVLGHVRIADNHVRDCQVGIRVATSHHDDKTYVAKSVVVENNRLELMQATKYSYVPFGMLVGNVDSARITGNQLDFSKRAIERRHYRQGIRVWGYHGRMILVSENRIAMATLGFRIVFEGEGPLGDNRRLRHLCVLTQNLVAGPSGTRLSKVTPEDYEQEQFNMVALET